MQEELELISVYLCGFLQYWHEEVLALLGNKSSHCIVEMS